LREPKHEIITIEAGVTDEGVANVVKDTIARTAEGWYGKKVLLKIKEENL
jgi:mitochondrial enoyl-[acyl-carrier protein] reductase / trans-2-enoyl-CoA reductase